jgi:pimeloyl-ACP methyl ester carboxylesterase
MAGNVKTVSWRRGRTGAHARSMTKTLTRPSGSPEAPSAAPSSERKAGGPIARVVAASLATGLIGAASLTLGVFGGAPEHVITGSALLAFALGWALLAVLSSRLTSWPQRWAVVPAVAMAAVGVLLLAFAPGDDTLTTAGWVWPPLLLALAVWVTVRTRRTLPGRARRLLVYPVLAAMAVAAVGGSYQTVRTVLDRSAVPASGRTYVVDGHQLYMRCSGSGGPTVVLEGGMGETSLAWSWIEPAVSGDGRVCAYDRAGQGWSGDAAVPQDAVDVADELHALLGVAGERGPYVLVGHSTGGTYAMAHAARYPADVAGLVLVDSSSPDQFTVLPQYAGFYSMWRRVSALLPSLARLGVGQVGYASVGATLPEPAATQRRAFATSPREARSQRNEFSRYPDVFRQAGALTSLGDRPLVVVTATQGAQPGWPIAQDRLANLSTRSSHRLVSATHASLLDDRRDSAAAVRAIEDVVRSVRADVPLPAK